MKRLRRKHGEASVKVISNNKKGMEMVQVAILVAIAIGLGILFKDYIGAFITKTFTALSKTDFY